MRIGIYAPFYWPFDGGAERVARKVGQELSREHDVTVFTFQFDPALPAQTTDGSVKIRRLQYSEAHLAGFTWVEASRISRVIAAADIDVLQIHSVTFPNVPLAISRAARRRRLPTILVPHGVFEAYQGPTDSTLPRRLAYTASVRPMLGALAWSSSHVALTSVEEANLLRRFRLPERRMTVVYNGFETPRTDHAEAKRFRTRFGLGVAPILLHVATVKPNKGHDVVIRALPRILSACPEVQYVSIGGLDGLWSNFATALHQRVMANPVSSQVHFLGHLPDDDLQDAYAAADVVLVPSLAETFPLSVLDAMAWGKPVIASRVGGTNQMIDDGVTGILIDANDSESLAANCIRLIGDSTLRCRLGTAARLNVTDRFGWEQVVERYVRICEQLVGPAHGA